MTTNQTTTSCDSKMRFVVTGFGPFCDALENPTSHLANQLVSYLEQHAPHLARRTTTSILETSAEAARTQLPELYPDDDETEVCLLHLGVNYRGTKFQLEQCAYNDASFRVPDERGYQPTNCCIVPTASLGSKLETTLPLVEVFRELQQQHSHDLVMVSTDPGRFVCNYTYYMSLDHCQSRNEEERKNKLYSLFLHVPPFAVVPEEAQIQFVVQLMESIDRNVTKRNDRW